MSCSTTPYRWLWSSPRVHHAYLDVDVTTGVRFPHAGDRVSLALKRRGALSRRPGIERPDF